MSTQHLDHLTNSLQWALGAIDKLDDALKESIRVNEIVLVKFPDAGNIQSEVDETMFAQSFARTAFHRINTALADLAMCQTLAPHSAFKGVRLGIAPPETLASVLTEDHPF